MSDRSPLAKQWTRSKPLAPRRGDLYGIVVHTTGTGVLERRDPLRFVLDLYAGNSIGGHYVIAPDGRIFQLAGEDERAQHVGLSQPPDATRWYATGEWVRRVSPAALAQWRARWPGKASPFELWPANRSPNDCYVGVELVPRNDRTFTPVQYESLAALLCDVRDRRGIALDGSRLLGHEDVHPLTRTDAVGGWDPGASRPEPRFSWQTVTALVASGMCVAPDPRVG